MSRLRIIEGGRTAQPFRLSATERSAIEQEVERLIAALDADDGDPEREDDNEDCCSAGDDEPRAGRSPGHRFTNLPLSWQIGDDDDAEVDAFVTEGR